MSQKIKVGFDAHESKKPRTDLLEYEGKINGVLEDLYKNRKRHNESKANYATVHTLSRRANEALETAFHQMIDISKKKNHHS